MLLRASGEKRGEPCDPRILLDPASAGDGGIPHGKVLVRFAEAVIGTHPGELAEARAALLSALGPEALVDASAVAANFAVNDRIADATGIPLDPFLERGSRRLRGELGLDAMHPGG